MGGSPQNLRRGTAHASVPPIFREVIGCVAKYELTKKRCDGGTFRSEIEVICQEKGHIRYISDFRQ